MAWYGVKTINKTPSTGGFEERIFVVRASNWDQAWDKAEEYAQAYADDIEDNHMQWAIVDIFHMFGANITNGTEVYSKTMVTDKSVEEMRQNYDWLYGPSEK